MKHFWGWNDWHIHPFTLVYICLALISHQFFEYTMALCLVCIHEMFHFIFAKIYHFDIEKVEVLPFGAFLSLRDYGMHHIIEELVTIMAGLSSHFFLYYIIVATGANPFLLTMNRMIFIFNILPIYPLDGAKILLLVFSTFMDYQKAIRLQIKISILILSIVIVLYLESSYFIIYGYLIYLNYQYIKEYRLQIIRLLLSRKTTNLYTKKKVHTSLNFYRPYVNVYLVNMTLYPEQKVVNSLIKRLKNN